MLKSYNNTTFRELKHRVFPTPMSRSRKPMPLEITTFRVAFVHTDYNLTYNLRESFYSSLRTIARIRFLRLSYACEQTKPLLVSILKSLSPKVLNQTDNGLSIYGMFNYFVKMFFLLDNNNDIDLY